MRPDRNAGIFLLIFSVLFYFNIPYAIHYNIYSKNVKGVFGADALPKLLAGLLMLCAVFLIVTGWRGEKEEDKRTDIRLLIHSGAILAVCLAYIFCMKSIGYFVSTFLMLFVVFLLFGEKRRLKAVLLSAAVVIPIYLVFGLFLKLYLPRGILF